MHVNKWGFDINAEGHLVVGGCDAVKLADNFGTPVHIVDKSKLLDNYNKFSCAFRKFSSHVEIFYSYKTNCLPGILKILHEEGAGAEVISHYELWLAIKLGVIPEKIIFNGPNKSLDSIRMAVQNNVKLINIDSMNEIIKIDKIAGELGKKANVGVRVIPPVGWNAQLGNDIESGEAFQVYEMLANRNNFNIAGMHVHIGTGIKNPSAYVKALEKMLSFAKILKDKLNINIKYLDIGGGFGVPTVKTFGRIGAKLYSVLGNIPDIFLSDVQPIETFAREILRTVQRVCRDTGLSEPELILEPGRNITSSAQLLLLTVGVLKERSNGKNIAIADGGKMTIANPVSYESHKVFVANRMSKKQMRNYCITGSLCTPADILFRNKRLPELEEGDILAIMDSGAYFMSLSNNFAFPRPPVVLASEGTGTVIRKRESFEYLIGMDELL